MEIAQTKRLYVMLQPSILRKENKEIACHLYKCGLDKTQSIV